VIELSGVDRARLEAVARKQTAERRQVLRARIVLGAADGDENAAMAERFGVALNTVIKWRKRFFEEGMDGLGDRKRSGRPRSFPPSGAHRGEGTGLPAASQLGRPPVSVELQGAGGGAGRAGGGGRHLGVDGVAHAAS
jgi:hypothetical protein